MPVRGTRSSSLPDKHTSSASGASTGKNPMATRISCQRYYTVEEVHRLKLLPGEPSLSSIWRAVLYPTARRRALPSLIIAGKRRIRGCDLIDYLTPTVPTVNGATVRIPSKAKAAMAKADKWCKENGV